MKINRNMMFIIITISLLALALIIFYISAKKQENEINNIEDNIESNVEDEENINLPKPTKTVDEIKEETGATAQDDIYTVAQEYDGREVLTIKPDIQFATVLAGILENREPTVDETNNINLTNFNENGIWIQEQSRESFLELLKECELQNFKIDENGYLYDTGEGSSSKYSSMLKNLINSDELFIISMQGTCYTRDEMTGEIVEYPFKDMDPYQVCEKYSVDGCKIIIITTNNVSKTDILEEICNF